MTEAAQQSALNEAARFYRSQLADSWVSEYLVGRGMGSALRLRWMSGYAPGEWSALVDHLHVQGYSNDTLVEAGLAGVNRRGGLYDRFRDRVMFPVRDSEGQVRGFIGRTAEGKDDERNPRWLNSPESTHYSKSELLHGLLEAGPALRAGATLVVVEGPIDAIAVTEAGRGLTAGVATCGTALTPRHAAVIKSVARAGVVVGFDADNAGNKAAARSWAVLTDAGIQAQRADLPGGADPAEVKHRYGNDVLVTGLTQRSRPLVDAALHAALQPYFGLSQEARDEPHYRVQAMRTALPILAQLPAAEMSEKLLELGQELGLDRSTLIEGVVPELMAQVKATPADVGIPGRLSDITTATTEPAQATAPSIESGQWTDAAFPSAPQLSAIPVQSAQPLPAPPAVRMAAVKL